MEVTVSKAVWSTAFVNDLPDSSFLYVESGGEKDGDGKTTPRSLRHFPYKDSDGKVDLPHLRNAIARIPQSNAPGLTPAKKQQLQDRARRLLGSDSDSESASEKVGRRMSGNMLSQLSSAADAIKKLVRWGSYEDGEEDDEEDEEKVGFGFKVFTDETGADRWITFSSNGFQDRELDIVATKALEDDVARAEKDGNRGPLLLWHIPAAKIGKCDFQGVEGRFLVESGTFDDTELGMAAKEYFQKSDARHGTSIGFTYPEALYVDGVYHQVRIRERSVCPIEVAANPFTSFEAIISGGMMNEQQKAWLNTVLGADRASTLLSTAEAATKELEGLYAYKALESKADAGAGDSKGDGEGDGADDEGSKESKVESTETKTEEQSTVSMADAIEAIGALLEEKTAPILAAVKAQDEVIKTLVERDTARETELASIKTVVEGQKTNGHAPKAAAFRATEVESNVLDKDKAVELFGADNPPTNPARAYVEDLIGKGAR